MKSLDLLNEYLYNRRIFLEHEVQQLQENVQFRSVGVVDCLELIIAKSRLDMFCEVSRDITHILKLRRKIPP